MRPLIIITGPTAVGKSTLSIAVAKKLNAEIISADSMQVYKGMNIGTDKISPEKADGIIHHMIDIIDPTESFDVYRFKKLAKIEMEKIYAKGRLPIIVGGTGFYIQALLYDVDFNDKASDDRYRAYLEKLSRDDDGKQRLYDMLLRADSKAAETIHKNNVKRVIRALEYHKLTGQKISTHNQNERQKLSAYANLYFVLNDRRDIIYDKIEKRIDTMLQNGLVDEVRALKASGCTSDMTSMQGIGYRQVLGYLEGEYDYDEMVRILKRDTRHFAKRQLTWFKRERGVTWLSKENYSDEALASLIIEKGKELLLENPI